MDEELRDFENLGVLILLEGDLFHAPAFLAHQFFQSFHQFRADASGVIGEIDQMSPAIFENLEAKFIAAVI